LKHQRVLENIVWTDKETAVIKLTKTEIVIRSWVEMEKEKVRYEEFRVDGDRLVAKIKELAHEGNIRRIIIKNDRNETLIEIPLTIGVVGIIVLPVWAAIGAIAALVANLNIVVERVVQQDNIEQ
jgi:hypothetical protein